MRTFALALALLLAGCASALRTTYQPVPLNGQTETQLDADHKDCQTIGHRAGQGLRAGGNGDAGLLHAGSGAGTLAGGSVGGATGMGAGIILGTYQEVRIRGLKMHAAYQRCMRERGYRGAQEEIAAPPEPARLTDIVDAKTGRPRWCRGTAPEFYSYRWSGPPENVCRRIVNGDILNPPAEAMAPDPGPRSASPASADPAQALHDYADGK